MPIRLRQADVSAGHVRPKPDAKVLNDDGTRRWRRRQSSAPAPPTAREKHYKPAESALHGTWHQPPVQDRPLTSIADGASDEKCPATGGMATRIDFSRPPRFSIMRPSEEAYAVGADLRSVGIAAWSTIVAALPIVTLSGCASGSIGPAGGAGRAGYRPGHRHRRVPDAGVRRPGRGRLRRMLRTDTDRLDRAGRGVSFTT